MSWILLFVSSVVAFWISAICGGGASLILLPVLNLLVPSSVVPFAMTIGTFTSSASRIGLFWRAVSWEIVMVFVPFSIPAVLAGAWCLKYLNPLYLQLVVALLLIANLPELFRKRKKMEPTTRYPRYLLAVLGFLAGFVSGITGAIGLLFNRFYLRYGLTKEQIVATRAANEIILHTIKLIIYILLGLYSEAAATLGLAIALGALFSTYSVRYILPYLSEIIFRKLGYAAMVVSGVMLMTTTSTQIVQQDNITAWTNNKDKLAINWRTSSFVLEFKIDEGLEVEIPIKPEELPPVLKQKYDDLAAQSDYIKTEKVFRLLASPEYEFYCYRNRELTKLEFDEPT